MDYIPYIWPYASYKISETYKKYFGESVICQTTLGPVRGYKAKSQFGYDYINFRGIPYAKPPVGDLRFKDPQPAAPWKEVLDVSSDTYACQKDILLKRCVGTEDCLHLNIYTKSVVPKQPYPVMVYIHGGAFLYGSNAKDAYNPEYLLRKDVLLVVINYRLGAFGFLAMDDPELGVPGNAGLKDQVMALKWINENIDRFGGDPNNITLFGESAGACSTHYHMVSDMSRGLFHKAIAMSGTAFNGYAATPIRDWDIRLGKTLGWDGTGGQERLLELLQAAKAEDIINAYDSLLTLEDRKRFITFPFGPVEEPYQSQQCFLPKNPKYMCRQPWSTNMPMIISGCSDEGLFVYKMVLRHSHLLSKVGDCEYMVPLDLQLPIDSDECIEKGKKLKKLYFGVDEPNPESIKEYCTFMTDKLFWHGFYRGVMTRLTYTTSAPTYLFRFNFDSTNFSLSKLLFAGKGVSGACHADDCSYLFKNAISSKLVASVRENTTMERMVDLWTTFALTGNPNSESISPIEWQPVTKDNPYICLNLADDITHIDLPERDRLEVWNSLYEYVELI